MNFWLRVRNSTIYTIPSPFFTFTNQWRGTNDGVDRFFRHPREKRCWALFHTVDTASELRAAGLCHKGTCAVVRQLINGVSHCRFNEICFTVSNFEHTPELRILFESGPSARLWGPAMLDFLAFKTKWTHSPFSNLVPAVLSVMWGILILNQLGTHLEGIYVTYGNA